MYPDFVSSTAPMRAIGRQLSIRTAITSPMRRRSYVVLASYAEHHGAVFARIEAVAQDKQGVLLALNLKSEAVREAVQAFQGDDVLVLYQEYGGSYQ